LVELADPATTALRGTNALPSVSTSWRFLAGADLVYDTAISQVQAARSGSERVARAAPDRLAHGEVHDALHAGSIPDPLGQVS